jgi:hypothetical protein
MHLELGIEPCPERDLAPLPPLTWHSVFIIAYTDGAFQREIDYDWAVLLPLILLIVHTSTVLLLRVYVLV